MIAAKNKDCFKELREDIANIPLMIAENKKMLIGISGVFAFILAVPTLVMLSDHLPTISDTVGTYIAGGVLLLGISIGAFAYGYIHSKKE